MPTFLVSKSDMWGCASPVAVCPSLASADALVDKLNAAVPKGALDFYSRQEVPADTEDFLVVQTADAVCAVAD
jgi:hypothetical protein